MNICRLTAPRPVGLARFKHSRQQDCTLHSQQSKKLISVIHSGCLEDILEAVTPILCPVCTKLSDVYEILMLPTKLRSTCSVATNVCATIIATLARQPVVIGHLPTILSIFSECYAWLCDSCDPAGIHMLFIAALLGLDVNTSCMPRSCMTSPLLSEFRQMTYTLLLFKHGQIGTASLQRQCLLYLRNQGVPNTTVDVLPCLMNCMCTLCTDVVPCQHYAMNGAVLFCQLPRLDPVHLPLVSEYCGDHALRLCADAPSPLQCWQRYLTSETISSCCTWLQTTMATMYAELNDDTIVSSTVYKKYDDVNGMQGDGTHRDLMGSVCHALLMWVIPTAFHLAFDDPEKNNPSVPHTSVWFTQQAIDAVINMAVGMLITRIHGATAMTLGLNCSHPSCTCSTQTHHACGLMSDSCDVVSENVAKDPDSTCSSAIRLHKRWIADSVFGGQGVIALMLTHISTHQRRVWINARPIASSCWSSTRITELVDAYKSIPINIDLLES